MAYFLPRDEMERFGGVPDLSNHRRRWTPREMMTEEGVARHELFKRILFDSIPQKDTTKKNEKKSPDVQDRKGVKEQDTRT